MTGDPFRERHLICRTTLDICTAGTGPTLVYLHAGDGLAKSANLIRCLAADFRVVAASPPGFDGSDPVDGYRTVDDLSYLMLDLLDTLALRDVILVGTSFGAWLAAEIAVKTVERLSRLVLINPVGIQYGTPDNQDICDIFYETHRDVRRVLYADGKPDTNDYSKVPADEVTALVRNRESLAWFCWSPLLNNPALRSRLHRIQVPTLIVRGENDRVVPEAYSRAFAESIPAAQLRNLSNAGHYMHDEVPEILAAEICDFAGRSNARDASSGSAQTEEVLP
jgi:pimeloyl-ACP methyl ester carboxylesterase